MLSLDIKVNEGGLKENRLLNQDRLGEIFEPAELGPEREGENGTGSMLRSALVSKLCEIGLDGSTHSSSSS